MTVTVIGTGVMGSALARALAGAGHQVTAWNRPRSRAVPLASSGVTIADGLLDAVRGSDPVIMCVSNQAAAAELLADPALTDLLRGRALIQMTTGTPADGRRNGARGPWHYRGEDAGRAAVVDAALIAFFYGTMAGLVQCVNLAPAEGIPSVI